MASGNTLLQWEAMSGKPPSTVAFATIARRNSHYVMNFDAAADESLDFSGVMPSNYAGGGVTVTLIWLAASATTGDVIWNADFERHQDDAFDLDVDGFAGVNAATGTAASATGEAQYTAITFTDGADMDSIAVGESFRLRITRDANNGSDTMTGDAQLLHVYVTET